jgi:hypothetical protein
MLMKMPVQPTPASRGPDPSGSRADARGACSDGAEILTNAIVFRHRGGPLRIRRHALLAVFGGHSDTLTRTPSSP